MGASHAERELGVQPRSYAREKLSYLPSYDAALNEYLKNRAFYITGLAKTEILDKAREALTRWAQVDPDSVLWGDFDAGMKNILADFLPTYDANGRKINVSARATVIARTNISDLYNTARMMMFNNASLKDWVVAFKYTAVMDHRTTPLCRTLHGRIFTRETMAGFMPPNHFNCRSTMIPITQEDTGWQDEFFAQGVLSDVKPQEGFEN